MPLSTILAECNEQERIDQLFRYLRLKKQAGASKQEAILDAFFHPLAHIHGFCRWTLAWCQHAAAEVYAEETK